MMRLRWTGSIGLVYPSLEHEQVKVQITQAIALTGVLMGESVTNSCNFSMKTKVKTVWGLGRKPVSTSVAQVDTPMKDLTSNEAKQASIPS